MSLKSARESHRARSLYLSSQNRIKYVRAAAGNGNGSTVAAVARSRHAGQGKGISEKAILEDEVMLARDEMAQDDELMHLHGSALASSHFSGSSFSIGPLEVALTDLIQVKRHSKHSSMDFEVVPRHKAVIALDDTLERRTHPHPVSSSSSSSSEGEDDWEILMDDDFGENLEKACKSDKKTTKSWASIVSRI